MQIINRVVVEKLAIEVHKITSGRVGVLSTGRTGPRRRMTYTMRPERLTYASKTGSRLAAAYLLGVLAAYAGPGGELSPLAREVQEILFPARIPGLDEAFLRGWNLAESQLDRPQIAA